MSLTQYTVYGRTQLQGEEARLALISKAMKMRTVKVRGVKTPGTLRKLGALSALALAWQVGAAQVVKAPRYTGGLDAPTQQLNLPPLPAAITPHGTIVEDVVVRVNDQIITRSDVEREADQVLQEAQQQQLGPAAAAQKQKDMLRDMIDQQLLLSRAKELGLNADADVIRQLDQIRIENKMASLDDLAAAAKQQGVSFEDFKAKIRNQILTQQVVRDEVGRRLQLSQTEETKYYQEHLKEFEQPEQVRLSEILVPLPDSATPAQIVAGEKKANDLKTQVMKGTDFADLAKKSSGGPTASQGGELGMFKRGALAKVLEDQTFDLKVGESTQPIRTRQGYVILKVTQHDQAGPAPMKDVEPQIQEALYIGQMQPALRAYLTKLREQSYVDIQPGFVDSGASAKETKPVFSAYAPPPVKVKKPKEQQRFNRAGGAAPKPVVSSPDTGGRTLTGADAVDSGVDPSTGLANVVVPPKPVNSKPGHTKREKVRFGQAPQNALPEAAQDVATAPVAPAAPANTTLGSVSSDAPAEPVNLADNPLNGPAAPKKKTRFAAAEVEVKQQKVQTAETKKFEKAVATPTPVTSEEKAAQQTQSAPLGLGGDTSKKPAKPVKPEGAPKERLQDKPEKPKDAPAQTIDQTANPALAPTADTPASTRTTAPTQNPNNAPTPVQNTPQTTLPPVTQPVPGSNNQGQPVLPPGAPQ